MTYIVIYGSVNKLLYKISLICHKVILGEDLNVH